MMSRRDDILREDLESEKKNAQYTSKRIHNEVIDLVAEYIRKENKRSLLFDNTLSAIWPMKLQILIAIKRF